MNIKGYCYPKSIILQAVYFKLRFSLSYRDIEEIMKMRGVQVDHATIQRWVHLLLQTPDEIGLKSDPEFRSAFVGYIEWETRLAVINSQLTENLMASNEPMPKWGWGETGGPYTSNEN